MLIAKKFRKPLFLLGAIVIVLYAWEYYCTTRPYKQCGKLCEMRSYVLFKLGNEDVKGYMCHPWYRYYWR